MKKLVVAVWVVVSVSLFIDTASAAATSPVVRPGTYPGWFAFGLGPSMGVSNAPSGQLLMVQTFGYHFQGRAEGPAIAFDLQEGFGGGVFILQTNPRFVWDIQIVRGLGLYLSPSVGVGYTLLTAGGDAAHGVTFPMAFKAKLILANRGLVFFQPVGIDLMAVIDDDWSSVVVQYDLLFGGGVIF